MSKNLYKLLIVMLKYIPIIISLCYLANTITAYVGIDIPVLSNIAGMYSLESIIAYTILCFKYLYDLFPLYVNVETMIPYRKIFFISLGENTKKFSKTPSMI